MNWEAASSFQEKTIGLHGLPIMVAMPSFGSVLDRLRGLITLYVMKNRSVALRTSTYTPRRHWHLTPRGPYCAEGWVFYEQPLTRIVEGQVAGRKTPKALPKNSSMLPMRRSGDLTKYGKRGPKRCLTPQSSKNRTLPPADCSRLQIAEPIRPWLV